MCVHLYSYDQMTCNHKTTTIQACLRAVLDGVPEPTLPHIPRVIIDYITTHQNYRSKGYVHNCQASSLIKISAMNSHHMHVHIQAHHLVDKHFRHDCHASSFVKIQHIHVHIPGSPPCSSTSCLGQPGLLVCAHALSLSLSLFLYLFMYLYMYVYI